MRTIIQLVLSVPIYIFAPFAWMPLVVAFGPAGDSSWTGRLYSFYFGVAVIAGLIALLPSIYIRRSGLENRKILTCSITVGLILGLSLAIMFLITTWSHYKTQTGKPEWLNIWYFAGPAIVAIWNLPTFMRALIKLPNHSPLQTSTSVTPSDDAAH